MGWVQDGSTEDPKVTPIHECNKYTTTYEVI